LRLVDGKVKKVWHQDGCGANGLVQVPNALLVACFDSGTVVKISLDGKPLKTIGKDSAGTHFTNPNDLRLMLEVVCISPPLVQTTQIWGKVFYFSSDQTVREVASGIHFAHRRALHGHRNKRRSYHRASDAIK
jgi:gluconolactonase